MRGRAGAAGPVVAHVSGAGPDELVLRDAVEYARRRQVPLRVLHTYRTAYVDPSGHVPPYFAREDATELVETAVAPWARAYPGVLVESVALPGPAADRLLEVSAGAGLLVVGARGGAGLPAAMRGSLTPGSHPPGALPGSDHPLTGPSVVATGVLGPCRWTVGVGRLEV